MPCRSKESVRLHVSNKLSRLASYTWTNQILPSLVSTVGYRVFRYFYGVALARIGYLWRVIKVTLLNSTMHTYIIGQFMPISPLIGWKSIQQPRKNRRLCSVTSQSSLLERNPSRLLQQGYRFEIEIGSVKTLSFAGLVKMKAAGYITFQKQGAQVQKIKQT